MAQFNQPVQRQRLWATWSWTSGKEHQSLFLCPFSSFKASLGCFSDVSSCMSYEYEKVFEIFSKFFVIQTCKVYWVCVQSGLDDKRNWGLKSSEQVNLAALLWSMYVETLCNILSRWKGRVRDRVGSNRRGHNGWRLMWIPCLRGVSYRWLFYFSGKIS